MTSTPPVLISNPLKLAARVPYECTVPEVAESSRLARRHLGAEGATGMGPVICPGRLGGDGAAGKGPIVRLAPVLLGQRDPTA